MTRECPECDAPLDFAGCSWRCMNYDCGLVFTVREVNDWEGQALEAAHEIR